MTEQRSNIGFGAPDGMGDSTPALAEISVRVNGKDRRAVVPPRMTLADFLRETLRLTGTHLACEQGVCGACTVHVDRRAVRSCLMFAVQADGSDVLTIEGLADTAPNASGLHPVQAAFEAEHGLQCGFCTPGFVMSAVAFLQRNPDPTVDELRVGLSGNLCRCTGYQGIVRALLRAAADLRAASAPGEGA